MRRETTDTLWLLAAVGLIIGTTVVVPWLLSLVLA